MKKLLVYLKDYKKECILAPLFKMLEASFELFVPLVIASMIDRGIATSDKTYIVKCCIILIVLAAVGLISALTAQFFAAKAATGFATALRSDLFKHLLGLSYKEYDEIGSATMITRMTTDVMTCQNGVNWFLRLMLRSPFVVFGAMIMAFTIDVKAALVFLIVIVILFAIVGFIMSRNIPMLERAQSFLDRVLLHARENLVGVRVLRAFSREQIEEEAFKEKVDDLYESQMKAAKISSLMNPVTYIIINLAIVCLIYVGAIRVDKGAISQGSVVALYNYMSQILVELIKLANMVVTSTKAIASGNRIAQVLEIKNSQEVSDGEVLNPDLTDAENKTADMNNRSAAKDHERKCSKDETCEYAVEFDHVYFKYNEGGDYALNDIDFKVKKGEIIGIIGGTGSGKTTLVNLIPRFYDATAGSVKVMGRAVEETDIKTLRSKVGFVFQKAFLFAGSIADNLRSGKRDADNMEMLEAMSLAVATDVIKSKAQGLEAQVGEAGKELSGGQKQRISIARALIKKPQILVLDDATSALDFATGAKLLNNIKELDYKPTVFIVSQRTNAMGITDKVYVLEDGNIIGQGSHEELLLACETYREIHNTQFGGMELRKEETDRYAK